MNGAEAGLTVDRVEGIVESGIQIYKTMKSRTSLSTVRYTLTDQQYLEQRKGEDDELWAKYS